MASRWRSQFVETLEDRRLLATIVEAEIVAVATPSPNNSTQLPTSLTQLNLGQVVTAEIWWREVGGSPTGIVGGRLDVAYSTSLLDAANLVNADYPLLASGSIDEPNGLVDNFGGATLVTPTPGQSPNYARLGYFQLTATANGTAQIALEPGDLQISTFAGENVEWIDVDLGTLTLTIGNQPPVAQPSSVTTLEDTARAFNVADFQFSDVEGDALSSITVGNLSLASGDTLTVDQGSGAIPVTNGMTITAAQIPSLTYSPPANAFGNARSTFDFTASDANAGVVAATMTIHVTPVNDPPVAQPSAVTTLEDTARAFGVADFQFSDVEGDALSSITVGNLSLASGDTLTVDLGSGATAVMNGMTITAAQIPSLTYTPAANAFGNARSTFNFTANDANAGVVAGTLTIHVTPVNDPPVAQASSVSTREDTPRSFAVSDFHFNDVEGDALASITISGLNLAAGDSLTVDLGSGPTAVTNGLTISAAQISSLVYAPAAGMFGAARSAFDFQVNDGGLGTAVATMTIHVTMDAAPGFLVSPISGLTSEAGGMATFSVVLLSQPIADVTIDLLSSDSTEGSVAPGSLTFSPSNWDQPQLVTVQGVDDGLLDGDIAYTIITQPAQSADPEYDLLNADDVAVTNLDDDQQDTVRVVDGSLVITGTNESDSIVISLASSPDHYYVRLNLLRFGPFEIIQPGRMIAFGLGGNDTIAVGGNIQVGADLFGGDGADYLAGSLGDDLLVGGPGNDRLLGGEGNNDMYGDGNRFDAAGWLLEGPDDGADTIAGREGNDRAWGGGGRDSLSGSGGDDYLNGGSGDDSLSGGAGDDLLLGGDGRDSLQGLQGNDLLDGGAGDDTLQGSYGNDLLLGGQGFDYLFGGLDGDLLIGGGASNVTGATSDVALRQILAEWLGPPRQLPAGLGTIEQDGVADYLRGESGADDFFADLATEPLQRDRLIDYRASDGDRLLT